MRELTKLMTEMKNLNFHVINIINNCYKNCCQFDPENDYYKSPTFALNIGTTLKQRCELVTFVFAKKMHLCNYLSCRSRCN